MVDVAEVGSKDRDPGNDALDELLKRSKKINRLYAYVAVRSGARQQNVFTAPDNLKFNPQNFTLELLHQPVGKIETFYFAIRETDESGVARGRKIYCATPSQKDVVGQILAGEGSLD